MCFCDLILEEYGLDVYTEVRRLAEEKRAELGKDEAGFAEWLCDYNEWAYIVYSCRDVLTPEYVSDFSKVRYSGNADQMLAEVRGGAARRREVRDAPHSCDCVEREREPGLAEEKRAIDEQLRDEYQRRAAERIGSIPDAALYDELMKRYGDGERQRDKNDAREGRLEVVGLCDFLLANPKILDLLRLPEHREKLLTVKKYFSWVYVPPS